jgi:hypothetical protein
MGYARNRPKLLPQKLRLIREHLHLDPAQMAEQIMSEIESHNNRRVEIKLHWVPNFELGKHEPDMLTLLGYSRLVKIPLNDFVDDAISTEAFRKRLGKEPKHKKKMVQHTKKRTKA